MMRLLFKSLLNLFAYILVNLIQENFIKNPIQCNKYLSCMYVSRTF